MAKSMPKVELILWGSSHMSKEYDFWKFFLPSMQTQQNVFETPQNNSKSGQKIDFDVADRVCRVMKRLCILKKRQVHVVSLGTNNIRFKEEDLFPYFKQIVDQCHLLDGCFLVLVSLVPSYSTDEISRKRFSECSQMLKSLADNKKVTFFNFNQNVTEHGTLVDNFFFHEGSKGFHLNKTGANLLALNLKRHLSVRVKPNLKL